ncbi:MAG: MFS transporter [Proteobacteria bacterium]|nr:MFS transporter [Pseudomonadota bacterium]MBU4298230.1 MFS transporter [Pseudomonadota bacterium]MCG2747498.1 MFS transporter [Desulfobulbaceae bacterium]
MNQDPTGKKSAPPLIWAFTTYFAEGLPYILIRTLSTFFFRASGVSLEATGLTSLYGLPWIVKFLWAPYLDSFGTKRSWLLITQGLLVCFFVLIALLTQYSWALPVIALLFFLASFFAASHDTAIDGYYLEALTVEEQARFVGYRVMAYRIAMMFGSGVIVTIGSRIGWVWAFGLAALVLGLLFLFHLILLPRCEQAKESIRQLMAQVFTRPFVLITVIAFVFLAACTVWYKNSAQLSTFPFSNLVGILLLFSLLLLVPMRNRLLSGIRNRPDSIFARSFLSFIDRDKITVIILFIICLRVGEFMLSSMAGPFFIDAGLKEHYGWITGAVGLPCSIIGAMAGGWLIARKGLQKMIWPFLLAQNLTNLAYMLLAFHLLRYGSHASGGVPADTTTNILFACAVAAFDYLAGGLGTAVLMTFLMGLCKGDFKAAHYAIGTGLMSVAGLYAGSFSGFLVEWFGYAYFFGISFVFSLPAMALIYFLPWPEVKSSSQP